MNIKKTIYENLKKRTNKNFNDESEINSIGIDSLDLVELVVDLEEKWDIHISDENLKKIKKVKDIIEVIEKATKK